MRTAWTFAGVLLTIAVVATGLAVAYNILGLAVVSAGIAGVTMGRLAHLAGWWDAE